MNNDLISRSALLKELEEKVYPEKYGEKCNAIDVINGVLQVIGEHSIAYDVDKVVEELQSESDRWKESGEAYEDEKELGVADGFKRAIEIVKSGGISKE